MSFASEMPESVLVRFKGKMQDGITLRDLVNAIPYYAIKAGLLTVEKKGKKNVFSGRILEIEGLPDLKVEPCLSGWRPRALRVVFWIVKFSPTTLLEFQHMFPDEQACSDYLERTRWPDGFVCSRCGAAGEAYRFEKRPTILRCRKCQRNTYLTAGTVMHATRTKRNAHR